MVVALAGLMAGDLEGILEVCESLSLCSFVCVQMCVCKYE